MVDTTTTIGRSESASDLTVEAGAPDVTPAMIEAGVTAFMSNLTDDPNHRQIVQAVVEIYGAMSRAGVQSNDISISRQQI